MTNWLTSLLLPFLRRARLWAAWRLLPSGYVVGRRSFGGVIKEDAEADLVRVLRDPSAAILQDQAEFEAIGRTTHSSFDPRRNPVRVYCERCGKTHSVFRDEDECSPGSWREDSTGLRWQDFREAVYAAAEVARAHTPSPEAAS